ARRPEEGAHARRTGPPGPVRLRGEGREPGRAQGRAAGALLRPHPLALRAQDLAARRGAARVPPAPLQPAHRELGPPIAGRAAQSVDSGPPFAGCPVPSLLLVAGLDARSLALEAPLLQRERHVIEERASG